MIFTTKENARAFIEKIPWFDSFTPYEKSYGNYPTLYEQFFPNTPYLEFCVTVLNSNLDLMFEFVKMGFTFTKGTSNFELVHFDAKIQISQDINLTFASGGILENIGYKISVNFHNCKKNKEKVEEVLNFILERFADFKDIKETFYMIAQGAQGNLYTQPTSFKKVDIKDNRYDLYYGEKFPHEKFVKFVTEETDNLMMLHGDPGTGKSNYIKNILNESKREVIYIPPSMLSVIASPGFVTFMLANKGKILLIEDAEEILSISRNTATNNLLGLTDGFLKDALDLKIICTFNCDIGKIDPALRRKGRLYFEYKFKPLEANEANKLVDYLKINRKFTEPSTLAEIFNKDSNSDEDTLEPRFIGFATT